MNDLDEKLLSYGPLLVIARVGGPYLQGLLTLTRSLLANLVAPLASHLLPAIRPLRLED
jgi:hypothetical protein